MLPAPVFSWHRPLRRTLVLHIFGHRSQLITMHVEDLREYALSLPDVTESFPFGNDTIVFKVKNKIFLLVPLATEILHFNVKCDPDYAVELREEYDCIKPGYHMNKKHWNTIFVDGTLSSNQLKKFVNDSYILVKK